MNKCCKIGEMIKSGELEIDLATETNETVQSHIAGCAECRDLVESLKKISSGAGSIKKIVVSDSFSEGLKIKLEAAKKENQKSDQPAVPLFTRMVYYVSGAAAMIIGFMYISSLGVFETKTNGSIISVSPASTQLVSEEQINESPVPDSAKFETLKDPIPNNEEINQVSTGE